MKAKFAFLKNFVQTHKVAITAGLTATAFLILIHRNQKELNKFLEEHNLTEAYYSIDQ